MFSHAGYKLLYSRHLFLGNTQRRKNMAASGTKASYFYSAVLSQADTFPSLDICIAVNLLLPDSVNGCQARKVLLPYPDQVRGPLSYVFRIPGLPGSSERHVGI